MYKWLINNFWLKLISLILAIVTWFYISGELNKRQDSFYRHQAPVMSKP